MDFLLLFFFYALCVNMLIIINCDHDLEMSI